MSNVNVLSNFLWRFAERFGAQLVSIGVSVVLTRMFEPELFGDIALVSVLTLILNVFVDSGMGSALIQKKDTDELDFSTVFYFNVTACLILYLITFLAAPYMAAFYNKPSLTPVIRVLSLTIVISGLKNIQQAYVSRNMLFRKFFFATLFGTVTSAAAGLYMAFAGYGIWALVAQQLTNTFIDTVMLWIIVPWRPGRGFSLERLKVLFSYGWKLLVSSLLDTTYNNIRQLVVGKLYSSSDLALYNRGKQFPSLLIVNINSSIDSVLLPKMSQEQDDIKRVKNMTRRAIKTSIYVMAPMMVGILVCGEPLVRFIYTEKWLPCVPYLRIWCIASIFYPIHTANLNAIKSLGRSDLFLKLEIIKKITGTVVLLSTMWFGVYVMCLSLLLESVLGQLINTSPNKKLMDYGYLDQLKDIFPGIMLASFMGLVIYPISKLGFHDLTTLVLMFFAGVAVYVAGSIILKIESFFYLWEIVKSTLGKFLARRGSR